MSGADGTGDAVLNISENLPLSLGEEQDGQGDQDGHIIAAPPNIQLVHKVLDGQGFDDVPGEIIVDQTGQLLKRWFKYSGKVGSLVDNYNHWIENIGDQISAILTFTVNDGYIIATNVEVFTPKITIGPDDHREIFPPDAYLNDMTYESDIYVDLTMYDKDWVEVKTERSVFLGSIPVMIGSVLDNTIAKQLTKEQISEKGMCPSDPSGYFIIKGSERIILMQEKLRVGRALIFNRTSAGMPICQITIDTPDGSSIVTLKESERTRAIKVSLSFMGRSPKQKKKIGRSISVFQVFRLLGVKSIDEMLEYINVFIEPKNRKIVYTRLIPTIVNMYSIGDSSEADIAYLAKKIGYGRTSTEIATDDIMNRLVNELFPQIVATDNSAAAQQQAIKDKLNMLGYMTAHYAEYLSGLRKMDDRDDWANKRIVTGGRSMKDLFGGVLKIIKGTIQADIEKSGGSVDIERIKQEIAKTPIVGKTFKTSMGSANWGLPNRDRKENLTDVLRSYNAIDRISQLTKIVANISKKGKSTKIRLVQMSQLGYVCVADTPEGQPCGLVKHGGITLWVSVPSDPDYVISSVRDYVSTQNKAFTNHVLWVNDRIIGWCNGQQVRDYLVHLRRTQQLQKDVEIVLSDSDNTLFVFTDGSRPTRPLLVVEDGQLVVERKKLWNAPIDTLLSEGAMEYIGAYEQHYIMLAPTRADIQLKEDEIQQLSSEVDDLIRQSVSLECEGRMDDLSVVDNAIESAQSNLNRLQKYRYTHCETDPTSLLGVSASLIPKSNHNQAPRNVYACGMNRQALGTSHSVASRRFDTTDKCLAFPSRPLFETQMANVFGLDEQPYGETVIMAIATYGGFNQEDAFIINKASLDRGLFRIVVTKSFKSVAAPKNAQIREEFKRPSIKKGGDPDRYSAISEDGLPIIGTSVADGACVIGKVRIVEGVEHNASTFLGIGQSGVIEDVYVTTNPLNQLVVKVRVRQVRIPLAGDKFASRHAQKTTIGLIMPAEDMPVTMNGITPDIIINPTAIPSRMTIGKLIEVVASKYGALANERINGTSFRNFDLDELRENLRQYGYNVSGKERLISGKTGKMLSAEIFMGPCFYMALRHHVLDKEQKRSTGAKTQLTHQPVGGRKHRGGQRVGEMERDALASHGASEVLRERLCTVSDAYEAVFCKECGTMSIVDFSDGRFECRTCEEADFGKCTIPYAFKLLSHLLAGAGVKISMDMKEEDIVVPADDRQPGMGRSSGKGKEDEEG